MNTKSQVKKTLFELRKEFGNVFQISDVQSAHPEVDDESVLEAINELAEEGLVTLLDEDSIQVNG